MTVRHIYTILQISVQTHAQPQRDISSAVFKLYIVKWIFNTWLAFFNESCKRNNLSFVRIFNKNHEFVISIEWNWSIWNSIWQFEFGVTRLRIHTYTHRENVYVSVRFGVQMSPGWKQCVRWCEFSFLAPFISIPENISEIFPFSNQLVQLLNVKCISRKLQF